MAHREPERRPGRPPRVNPPVRASGSVRLLVVGLAWIGATLFGLAVAATTTTVAAANTKTTTTWVTTATNTSTKTTTTTSNATATNATATVTTQTTTTANAVTARAATTTNTTTTKTTATTTTAFPGLEWWLLISVGVDTSDMTARPTIEVERVPGHRQAVSSQSCGIHTTEMDTE